MTQPKTASKFTPGALRAAEIIRYIRIQAPHGDRHQLLDLIPILRDGTPSDSTMESTMAHIIDRETGVAELLEAAKNLIDSQAGASSLKALHTLEQAIAKCEGGE